MTRPFNPRHEEGRCRWCGGRLRPYGAGRGIGYSRRFCTIACAIAYAELTLDKGVHWIRRPDAGVDRAVADKVAAGDRA